MTKISAPAKILRAFILAAAVGFSAASIVSQPRPNRPAPRRPPSSPIGCRSR
jgi:hypothetical protein